MDDLDINKFIEENAEAYEFKEITDTDTHVIHDMKLAAKRQLLWPYIKEMGIPAETNMMSAVYYFYSGRYKKIDRKYIYMCRNRVQPSKWFYNHKESLPARIGFSEKYTCDRLLTEYTVGHLLLLDHVRELTFPGFAEKYGFRVTTLKNMVYKRFNEVFGKEIIRIQPPDEIIMGLKDVINPDWWFIFPEEAETLPDRLR